MAHREFIDPQGVRWQAWEVIPTTAERRSSGERRFRTRNKSAREKRRLHPIPPNWSVRTDEELSALCGSAEAAPRTTPRLVE
jgi:hypothetical protein